MSCPECFSGAAQEGTPRGRVGKAYGLDVYIAEPPEGTPLDGILVIVPDAFGWEFVNTRLLADRLAQRGGYRVYLPDFMEGCAAPLSMLDSTRGLFTSTSIWSKIAWVPSLMTTFLPWAFYTRMGKTGPVVEGFFRRLRKDTDPQLPIGAVGFCWGGKHVIRMGDTAQFAIDGRPLFDAAFVGHPIDVSIPADIQSIGVPFSFALGDKDHHVSSEGATVLRGILAEKPEGQKGELVIYPNCGHGFALRADLTTNEVAKQAADEAEEQCITWFKAHLKPRTERG
ncbi:hypothetical protein VTK73DRAFT_4280 [Phialemonium thermophilum]|uniref:Dienelactone hydrolase domain-containing protein n=1 Tax=Phialemonium thermophilum TaxID=223376 RepID=A0ABR3WU08_9PEZI